MGKKRETQFFYYNLHKGRSRGGVDARGRETRKKRVQAYNHFIFQMRALIWSTNEKKDYLAVGYPRVA